MEIIEFVSEVGKLKNLERTGWRLKGVKNPEKVSDHSFMVAVLAMLFSKDSNLNSEKCIKMALIHDVPEVYIGDIATRFNEKDQTVDNKEKSKLEKEGLKKLLSKSPEKYRKDLEDNWLEFFEQKTDEAKFVMDMDKIEMVLQALEYKKSGILENGEEFFETAEKAIKTDIGVKLFKNIKSMYFNLNKTRKRIYKL